MTIVHCNIIQTAWGETRRETKSRSTRLTGLVPQDFSGVVLPHRPLFFEISIRGLNRAPLAHKNAYCHDVLSLAHKFCLLFPTYLPMSVQNYVCDPILTLCSPLKHDPNEKKGIAVCNVSFKRAFLNEGPGLMLCR